MATIMKALHLPMMAMAWHSVLAAASGARTVVAVAVVAASTAEAVDTAVVADMAVATVAAVIPVAEAIASY